MPRPKIRRLISKPPCVEGFKPFGIPAEALEAVVLLFEEYESIKLSDYEKLTHEQSAEKMNISRPTFTRIYEQARRKIAQAFVEGKIIIIGSENENIYTEKRWYRCKNCSHIEIEEKEEVKKCNSCYSENIFKFKNMN